MNVQICCIMRDQQVENVKCKRVFQKLGLGHLPHAITRWSLTSPISSSVQESQKNRIEEQLMIHLFVLSFLSTAKERKSQRERYKVRKLKRNSACWGIIHIRSKKYFTILNFLTCTVTIYPSLQEKSIPQFLIYMRVSPSFEYHR